MNKLLIIACMFVIIGCSTPDPKPNVEPDRGTIPTLCPIKPPSLTNEWNEMTNVCEKTEYILAYNQLSIFLTI